MKQYLDLLQTVLETGTLQENRTGIKTISVPGAMMKFDMQEGFPAITTRKLAFKTAMSEMVGFLRAYKNAADFRSLGCKVWDQNANENAQWLANPYRESTDDLGEVYGVQWRQWPAYKLIESHKTAQIDDALSKGYSAVASFEHDGQNKTLLYKAIDQLRQCLDTIVNNPTDRRIIFHGWNCTQLDQMALPPCHLLYHFLVNTTKKELSLCLYIRSNDLGLGAPFNIAEAAALLHLLARLSGNSPRWLTYFIGDAHIYENHLDMVNEQLKREPYTAPKLIISDRVPELKVTGIYEPDWLEKIEPDDFNLVGYEHHSPLSAPMAV